VVALVAVYRLLDSSRAGRRFKEDLLFSVPVLGRLHRNSVLARMAHSLATAVSSGASLPAGLRMAAGATGSIGLIEDCELLAKRLEAGENLTDAALMTPRIPRLFTYALQIAAQRNELPHGLRELADMYEQHAQQGQASLRTILLPLLLIGVGCIVGMMILSLFLPLVSLIDSVTY
jgi:type IV pilus assembly protein PilC